MDILDKLDIYLEPVFIFITQYHLPYRGFTCFYLHHTVPSSIPGIYLFLSSSRSTIFHTGDFYQEQCILVIEKIYKYLACLGEIVCLCPTNVKTEKSTRPKFLLDLKLQKRTVQINQKYQ